MWGVLREHVMTILRSIFWLTLAFIIIGPQIDIPGSISQISERSPNIGADILFEQKEQGLCSLADCIGANIAISAGLQVATDIIQLTNGNISKNTIHKNLPQPQMYSPVPRPRLHRAG